MSIYDETPINDALTRFNRLEYYGPFLPAHEAKTESRLMVEMDSKALRWPAKFAFDAIYDQYLAGFMVVKVVQAFDGMRNRMDLYLFRG
jgi:hypothetical protein